MDEWRRSGQIPAFGNWDQANDLPITLYFESARQAGLIRHSTNSSGECGHRFMHSDLNASDFNKPSRYHVPPRKTRTREERGPHSREQRKQGKVCDVTGPARKQQPTTMPRCRKKDAVIPPKVHPKPPKAVDEDLYKIPPELLRSSKRKKYPGLFSCLVPACAS
ncbi:hypothetical protein SADUNF_Sadunf13G0043800 [Salix dunnii]|uniref:RIN4 pathogenic type III effector avirulence factor Avr cleavage site domain-containing protein n=1 Tax=Salix dunnii TaxID=1413687 RepID=A0A835JJ30_9ROSI|nr:hypothetical protein SADUNF_Sadunf13G0043800 [Salix dunnii]